MPLRFEYAPGATPIDPDEAAELIPVHLTLQRELDEYEEANFLEATEWAFARRRGDPLDSRFVHAVHRRMFNRVWRWAGRARRSDKNLGAPWIEIPTRLHQMLPFLSFSRKTLGQVVELQTRALVFLRHPRPITRQPPIRVIAAHSN